MSNWARMKASMDRQVTPQGKSSGIAKKKPAGRNIRNKTKTSAKAASNGPGKPAHQTLSPHLDRNVDPALLFNVSDINLLENFQLYDPKDLGQCLLRSDSQLLLNLGTIDPMPAHKKSGTFVALDCEFVGTGPKGSISELARVSIVNYHGVTLLDQYVKPRHFVTDWRTKYSGITPGLVRDAVSFDTAQTMVADILKGRTLIGHGLSNDMKVLMLPHPKSRMIDTQVLQRWRDNPSIGSRPGLKRLLQGYFGINIQSGSHDSVEDARASMLIFRVFKNEFQEPARLKRQ